MNPTRRGIASIPLLAAAALFSMAADAQTLYAVSVRTYSDPGYKGVEGNLYKVEPDTGATSLLTSLTMEGRTIGLDGLAIHPATGEFYGMTPPNSALIPRSLVKVDPENGHVSLIGDLGHDGSDIAFDQAGTLYIWLPNSRQLGTVNLATGAVTPLGHPGERGALKGGLSLIGGGIALIAATGGTGTVDTVDMATGVITAGPRITGAPFPDFISGLAYSPKGVLYAINTNFGASSLANLVTIDPKTGKVTSIGPLPNDTDAMAFGPATAGTTSFTTDLTQWRLPLMVFLGMLAAAVLVLMLRPRK
jgi:hypothetical protein